MFLVGTELFSYLREELEGIILYWVVQYLFHTNASWTIQGHNWQMQKSVPRCSFSADIWEYFVKIMAVIISKEKNME